MGIGNNLFFWPLLLNPLYKDSSKICELFWHVKTEILIFGKNIKINSYKTESQFILQPKECFEKYLAHNTL